MSNTRHDILRRLVGRLAAGNNQGCRVKIRWESVYGKSLIKVEMVSGKSSGCSRICGSILLDARDFGKIWTISRIDGRTLQGILTAA